MNVQLQKAVTLDQAGNLPAAIAAYRKVLTREPSNVDALFLLGRVHCMRGEFERGAELLGKAASLAPQYGQAHNLLGMALVRLGRREEALASFERATAVDPANAMAFANRADVLADLGRHVEALAHYDKAVELDPRNVAGWCNRGSTLQALGRDTDAADSFGRAIVLAPNVAAIHFNMANALDRLGRHEEAIQRYRQAIALKPDLADAYINLASPLIALGRWQEAVECSDQAIKLRPEAVQAHCNRGLALSRLERHEESLASFDAALAIDSDYARALMSKSSLAYVLGRLDDARAAAEKMSKIDSRQARSYLVLAQTKEFALDDPQLAEMESLVKEGEALSTFDRMALHFSLGEIYEKLGEHERSFRHYLDGNTIQRQAVSYDENLWLGTLGRIPRIFTPEFLATKAGHGDPSAEPIFIVGMPRSGTTLVEQILAGHPRVHSCGEIRHFAFGLFALKGTDYPENVRAIRSDEIGELAGAYLKKAMASIPAAADRFTDKMPGNVLYAGLIHLVFPNARIIHVRRHPIDNCVSCFSQFFVEGQPYANDLGELGRYYRAVEQVAAHWHRVLPSGIMLDVQYEEVVTDIETQARKILDFCGLEWSDACLDFHKVERPILTASAAQVRKPLYSTSVGRWRAYGDRLQPLFEALGISEPFVDDANAEHQRESVN
jgi:tetratricopeptide (TPR) repeat protein